MSRWKVVPDINCYFITTTIVEWKNVFTTIPCFDIMIDSLKYCIAHKSLHLHGFVIMLNHAHYIVSTDRDKNLSEVMRDFGTHTSRCLTEFLEHEKRIDLLKVFKKAAEADRRGNRYKVWQEGFHPITIESDHFFTEKLNYIHENPVRKGFVDRPSQWRYSSARNYELDDESAIAVEKL
jgi:putative transposase